MKLYNRLRNKMAINKSLTLPEYIDQSRSIIGLKHVTNDGISF